MQKAGDKGWIKLHRCWQYTDDYNTDEFCRSMAWVDPLLLANHKTGIIRKRGIRINLKRGDVGYSLRTLAMRWQWSVNKVRRFLDELEADGRIVQQKDNVMTCITIVNYNRYQSEGKKAKSDEDVDGTQTV